MPEMTACYRGSQKPFWKERDPSGQLGSLVQATRPGMVGSNLLGEELTRVWVCPTRGLRAGTADEASSVVMLNPPHRPRFLRLPRALVGLIGGLVSGCRYLAA